MRIASGSCVKHSASAMPSCNDTMTCGACGRLSVPSTIKHHTQMIEQRAPKTTLHQRSSFAIEVLGRLSELTQA